ncbi:phosphoadenosine phosphosulfate reductase domain-containing protein [Streptomyces fulvoviolaceus]|uniref:phosphoadenosine phosphosulfate reductase domain-containing protein n=1 Tax=Streptomyces fulvoviolaceus TaxID=285535 RepID=UPI0021C16DDF|nr:phosphoadenosine phosphosulfate reductase family protein [Streptomyces fulvoviolaceus]MCT9075262.1 phosphoadenosine phosphosulfate reductase family protein [Streptomyces fulvoviolaceus]
MPRNLSTPPPCGSACGAQLELFAPPPLPAPAAGFDWERNDVVIVGDSGGKDSGVLVHEVCTQADQAGQLHKVRVLHCDLGRTPNGHLIEWPGALEVARSHADLYGVPFAVRRSQRWPSLWDRVMDHGNFPGFFARFCTSDLKTAVGRDYVDEIAAELRLGRPIRAGYAMGMRAEESRARAKKPVIEQHRMTAKTLRDVTTWLPVHHLKTDEVWKAHRKHGIPWHPAYEHVGRLSCRACPLAKRADLIASARINREIFTEWAGAEQRLGKPFKKNLTLKQIIELARS